VVKRTAMEKRLWFFFTMFSTSDMTLNTPFSVEFGFHLYGWSKQHYYQFTMELEMHICYDSLSLTLSLRIAPVSSKIDPH